jgi:hypothetical protein
MQMFLGFTDDELETIAAGLQDIDDDDEFEDDDDDEFEDDNDDEFEDDNDDEFEDDFSDDEDDDDDEPLILETPPR